MPHHLVQNLPSSHLLLCNINIKIQTSVIFPVVLYRCEAWTSTLEEHWVLREMPGSTRDEVNRSVAGYITRSFMICTATPNMLQVIKECNGSVTWHVQE